MKFDKIIVFNSNMANYKKKMNFCLSIKGLQNLNRNLYENDFKIEFDNYTYNCPSFLAEFISPKIQKLRKEDSLINEFHINYSLQNQEETIKQLEKLIYGFLIEFSEANKNDEIVSVLFSLGNNEIFNTEAFSTITKENVFSLHKIKKI